MDLNKQVKNLDVLDIGLTKGAMIFLALGAASFWPVLISLDWYWYAVVFVFLAIRPMTRFWR